MAGGSVELGDDPSIFDHPKNAMVEYRRRNVRHTSTMLPLDGDVRQFAATTGLDREHCVLRVAENRRMTFPFLLIQEAILIQIHPKEAVEHFVIVNLGFGKLAILVAVPFLQSFSPSGECNPFPGVTARR